MTCFDKTTSPAHVDLKDELACDCVTFEAVDFQDAFRVLWLVILE